MITYIIRRLLALIPTLFIMTILVFLLVRLVPGDIIDMMQSQIQREGGYTKLDRAMLERIYGLDKPIHIQYGQWVGVLPRTDGNFSGLLQGDLGVSWYYRTNVTELVAKKWPVTLELGLMGIIIAQLIAIPIGIYSALRQDTWGDYIGRTSAILFISVPAFWIATILILYPSIWWSYMPSIILIPFTEDPIGNVKMFIVPANILGASMAGATMRMTRTTMLEVLRQDYIRTAWAKGLRERVVIMRHALKNAFIPVITVIGMGIPVMVGGTVIIEEIFVLPGMGRLIVNAIRHRDYPLLTGTLLVFAVALVLINLVVDLSYAYLDPRVQYK